MKYKHTNVSHSKSKNIKKRLYAAISLLLVAILLVTATTFAWMSLSTAPQITGASTMIGANGNLEIALATTEHLAALKAQAQFGADQRRPPAR